MFFVLVFAIEEAFRVIIAANWKMNLDRAKGEALVGALNMKAASWSDISVVICPPSPYLQAIRDMAHEDLHLGGQTCHAQKSGAFTGHVSADMLSDCRASHVIIGHSERRQLDGETGSILAQQAQAAVDAGLQVIFCVGETLEDRQANRETDVVSAQLNDISDLLRANAVPIIAYEPVWAIGTGQVASVPDIQLMHDFIKSETKQIVGGSKAPDVLYGGSVKSDNAESILSIPSVDGALVGGASLDADGFSSICDHAQNISQQTAG